MTWNTLTSFCAWWKLVWFEDLSWYYDVFGAAVVLFMMALRCRAKSQICKENMNQSNLSKHRIAQQHNKSETNTAIWKTIQRHKANTINQKTKLYTKSNILEKKIHETNKIILRRRLLWYIYSILMAKSISTFKPELVNWTFLLLFTILWLWLNTNHFTEHK